MNCTVALERMLEADLDELAGATDSALSLHLRECDACRQAARRIVAAEGELAGLLAGVTPRRGVDQVARFAERRARRRWIWRATPLAAAAVLVAVLVARREPVERTLPPTGLPRAESGIAVEAPSDRSVAVFTSDNSDIVVFWFF